MPALTLPRRPRLAASALALALASGVGARPARAELTKEACIDADEAAQRARLRGELREAQRLLRTCAQADCPVPLRAECTTWLEEVDAGLPTVVVDAVDDQGRFVDGVRVQVDDVEVAQELGGRALAVDPGRRRFRFVRPDGTRVVLEETILEGEKNRRLTVRFPAPLAARPPPPRRFPTEVVPFAAVSALGAASFAYFGLRGSAQEADLRATCGSRCRDEDARSVQTKYLAADVSLAVSAVALGLGTWFFVRWLGEAPQGDAPSR